MDCLEGMKQIKHDSVDLIVTDPPYGYSFMGKDWDKAVPSVDIWNECFRILKHGAFCFVMSAPRQDVQSQMIIRLQEAGFNVRFTPLYWASASGFPKASNISKMVDKQMGVEREKTGEIKTHAQKGVAIAEERTVIGAGAFGEARTEELTKATSPQAKALDGSYGGFQPKPAVELILVAMKPCTEKTYVNQALKNNKGITWLDDCRIPYDTEYIPQPRGNLNTTSEQKYGYKNCVEIGSPNGRFPANLLVSDDCLNDGNVSKSSKINSLGGFGISKNDYGDNSKDIDYERGYEDSGSFSRYFDLDKWFINKLPNSVKKTFPFFIVPKASKGEKDDGMNEFEEGEVPYSKYRGNYDTTKSYVSEYPNGKKRPMNKMRNIHPTVKPTKLISYLITLASREGDLILDPFMGSGTTAIASRQLSRNFIGYEKDKEYHKICLARIKEHLAQKKLFEVSA